jgi:hypothetical protein
MKISIDYKQPQVVQALRYHYISRREIKLLLILVNVFALLTAFLFYAKKILPLAFLLTSVLWFILMITFWFLLPRTIYKRTSTFKDHIDMDLQETGLYLTTNRGVANWPYNKFQYYIESPAFFHLYINDKSFFLLPKDACVGDADTVNVRKLLTEKIGRKP